LNRAYIQPRASADAVNASAWYERQKPDLGIEFILELDAAIEQAVETPEAYARQYRNARRVLLRRFPYAVYFVFEGDTIEIFAVLHQHQDPTSWQSRLP
jgi:plasmid stabilization system protein ParE